MQLLLDVGNSRLKWATLADDGRWLASGSAAHDGRPAQALPALDGGTATIDRVLICNVAGPAHELELKKACLARWRLEPQIARSEAVCDGLRNAYAEPQRLGTDRWLAMLAAWRRTRGALAVVDAGTALTVDLVDADGRHLGGIIAAGLYTAERAVLGATRFASRDAPLPDHAGLGTDTETCVRQGAMLAVLGAIDRAVAALPGARRYLCGGDAARLLPLLGAGWEHREHLVLEGLAGFTRSD